MRNEIRRGKELKYNGKVERYNAKVGQEQYEYNRENCGRKNLFIEAGEFLNFVILMFENLKWSLDASFGYALKKIKNIDLPVKVRRKNHKRRIWALGM